MTKTITYKINTNAREAPAPSSPSELITMLKGMTKHEDKEHGKTLKHEAPRSINHKATQNKIEFILHLGHNNNDNIKSKQKTLIHLWRHINLEELNCIV